MTREIAPKDLDSSEVVSDESERATPSHAPDERPRKGKVEAREKEPKEPREPVVKVGPDIRSVRTSEDQAVREFFDSIGTDGVFKVKVVRKAPETIVDHRTGKLVKTGGFLKHYTTKFDESTLLLHHGGGTYQLHATKQSPTGSYTFAGQRTIEIAGEPNLLDPCLNQPAFQASAPAVAPAGPGPTESPTLAAKAMDVLTNQLEAMREDRNGARSDEVSPVVMQMVQMMKDSLEASQRELAEMRRAQMVPPATDPFKDQMLTSLMQQDNARIGSVRAQYESEIRVVKENAQAELRRLEERADRYASDSRQSHEREMASLRQSHDVSLQAVKASFETQAKLLEMEVRRLERDNTELRTEVKELRAKHGKGIVEQAKELNAVKEALGLGDDSEEQSTVDKIIGAVTNPATMEFAQKFMGNRVPAPPPVVAQPAGRRPVLGPDGNQYMLINGQMVPIKKKKKVIPTVNADGTPGPVLPAIPDETSAMVIGFLERAYAAGTDPVLVAQSYRAQVPGEIMTVIREHGVDVYLQKVARLPGGSPLSTQAGKNWVRKVGEALVE